MLFGLFAAVLLLVALGVRLRQVLPNGKGCPPSSRPNGQHQYSASTLVVLGSGGHTAEMLGLIKHLNPQKFYPLHILIADTDPRSRIRADAMLSPTWKPLYHSIPRSREVGQSWFSTIFTTLLAILKCIQAVGQVLPEVIICNGPGTCAPVCLVAFVIRFLGIKRIKIVFVESFCRPRHLSFTGRILYCICDRFIVHWKGLADRLKHTHPRIQYLGTLL